MEIDKEELLSQISQSESELIELDNTINKLKEELNKRKSIEEENENLLYIHNINKKYIFEYEEEIKNLETINLINFNDILDLKNEISKNKESNVNKGYMIDEHNMINEENIIVEADLVKEVFNSGVDNSVIKLEIILENEKEQKIKTGTGFFCDISSKKMKALITNNHLLDEDFFQRNKEIIYYTKENVKRVINLELNRFIYTEKDLDFTIIEILKEDNIINFLEIDENINTKNYKNNKIFCYQYPLGGKLFYSHGIHLGSLQKFFLYSIGTDKGSSGSPILLLGNRKLIGLHKAGYSKDKNKDNKKNIGIPINLILDKIDEMNYIICTYEINKENIGKEIQIISETNKKIKGKLSLMINGENKLNIFKLKFDKEGKFNIIINVDKSLTDMSNMFENCQNLKKIDLSKLKNVNVTNISNMFVGCSSLKHINFKDFNTGKVSDMSRIFSLCISLKKINLSFLKTDNVTDMSYMFFKCKSLKNIDLSAFITKKLKYMNSMFAACHSLQNINLSSFNTENVNDMSDMFIGCSSLKEINLSNFKTNNVTNMSTVFYGCISLVKVNLSSFNTDNVKKMISMFYDCSSLEEINLSNFRTNNNIELKNKSFGYGVFDNVPSFSKLICYDNNLINEFYSRKKIYIRNRISYEDHLCM